MKLLVIGAGNMGLTYAKGINNQKGIVEGKIMLLEANEEHVASLNDEGVFEAFTDASQCVSMADVILLGVKPQHTQSLFASIKSMVNTNQIFVSVMAGVKVATIQTSLGVRKVVRAMPNLPAQIGLGMTTFTCSQEVNAEERKLVQTILETTGLALHVESENEIDQSTGVSGSGPAYVFYFMENMMLAALEMGFDARAARSLVGQTFKGAVELYLGDDLSTEEWMNRVASKGGTTRAALDSMAKDEVGPRIQDAVKAAYNRAVELGNS